MWLWDFVLQPFYIAATGSGKLLDETGQVPIFSTPEAARQYADKHDPGAVKYAVNCRGVHTDNPGDSAWSDPLHTGE